MTWTRQQRHYHRGKCPGCGEPSTARENGEARDGFGRWWHIQCWLDVLDNKS